MIFKPQRTLLAIALASLAGLTGCATAVANPASSMAPEANATAFLGGNADEPAVRVIKSNSDKPLLSLFAIKNNTALPNSKIEEIRLSRTTIEEALRIILASSHTAEARSMTYSFEGDFDTDLLYKQYPGQASFKGTLSDAFDSLSKAYGFFYSYDAKSNHVTISMTQRFHMELPPLEGLEGKVAESLQGFGAKNVLGNDKLTTYVQFDANRTQLSKIQKYVQTLRAELSQIVYEVSIIEVRLNQGSEKGINWRNFSYATNKGTATGELISSQVSENPIAGLNGLLTFTVGKLNVQALLNFLDTQGTVKVTNQPILPIISGSSAKISVGEKLTFISNITNTVSGDNGVQQSGVTTSQLETGTMLEVSGKYTDSTVFTKFNLTTSDLLSLQKVIINNTEVQLPQTANREFNTPLMRIRPGDTMVMGGIISTRDTTDDQSVGWLPLSRAKGSERTELVVLVKPTVIKFAN